MGKYGKTAKTAFLSIQLFVYYRVYLKLLSQMEVFFDFCPPFCPLLALDPILIISSPFLVRKLKITNIMCFFINGNGRLLGNDCTLIMNVFLVMGMF